MLLRHPWALGIMESRSTPGPATLRHHDAGLVGHLLVSAALRRQESRGGHTRLDFPETSPIAEHVHTLADEPVGANPGGTA